MLCPMCQHSMLIVWTLVSVVAIMAMFLSEPMCLGVWLMSVLYSLIMVGTGVAVITLQVIVSSVSRIPTSVEQAVATWATSP